MTNQHDKSPSNTSNQDDHPQRRQSFVHMLQSVFAAIFGIQSERNRQEDFKKGDPAQYVTLGIVAAVALVIIMMLVVRSVLSSAGV